MFLLYVLAVAMTAASATLGFVALAVLFALLAGAIVFKHEITAAASYASDLFTSSFYRTDP